MGVRGWGLAVGGQRWGVENWDTEGEMGSEVKGVSWREVWKRRERRVVSDRGKPAGFGRADDAARL